MGNHKVQNFKNFPMSALPDGFIVNAAHTKKGQNTSDQRPTQTSAFFSFLASGC